MEGCLFTGSCLVDQKVKFSFILIHLATKDWWKMVTSDYPPVEKFAVTWDQFKKMFHTEYVLLPERERLA